MKMLARFSVNGEPHEIAIEPHWLLIEILRDRLGFTGTKHSCGVGNCGACTVLVDDVPVLACMTLALAVRGKNITTIEGLERRRRPSSSAAGVRHLRSHPVRLLHARA